MLDTVPRFTVLRDTVPRYTVPRHMLHGRAANGNGRRSAGSTGLYMFRQKRGNAIGEV